MNTASPSLLRPAAVCRSLVIAGAVRISVHELNEDINELIELKYELEDDTTYVADCELPELNDDPEYPDDELLDGELNIELLDGDVLGLPDANKLELDDLADDELLDCGLNEDDELLDDNVL